MFCVCVYISFYRLSIDDNDDAEIDDYAKKRVKCFAVLSHQRFFIHFIQ